VTDYQTFVEFVDRMVILFPWYKTHAIMALLVLLWIETSDDSLDLALRHSNLRADRAIPSQFKLAYFE
jgi:hypothetical protein